MSYIEDCKSAERAARRLVGSYTDYCAAVRAAPSIINEIMRETGVGPVPASDEVQRAFGVVFGPGPFANEKWNPLSPLNPGMQRINQEAAIQ